MPREEAVTGNLDIEVDSTDSGVSIKFGHPIKFFVLSSPEARLFGQAIIDKVDEAERISLKEVDEWLTTPLDLDVVTNLKALLNAVQEVGATKEIPAQYQGLKRTLQPVLKRPDILDAIGHAVTLEVADQECSGDVKRRLQRFHGDEVPGSQDSVAFLNWIAMLPTNPPPKLPPT